MARTPDSSGPGTPEQSGPEFDTIADFFVRIPNNPVQSELESFRQRYESINGESPAHGNYASQLPVHEQIWMIKHAPKRYWSNLPDFYRAFLSCSLYKTVKNKGTLDNVGDHWISAVCAGVIPLSRYPLPPDPL